jgi:catechol-2,3-dioxygenase
MTDAPNPTATAVPGSFRTLAEPTLQAARLGYVAMRTADVAAATHYFADALQFVVVEQTAKAAYLTTGADHHCVVIEQGEAHGRARVGIEVNGSLDDAQERLRAAGIESDRRSDPEPGLTDTLVLAEPGTGIPLELYERQQPSGIIEVSNLRPTKLGHVAAYVPDLAQIQGFYEDHLGFKWADTIGDFFAFLRCGPDHHAVNFMESSKKTGLHHIAFEVRDFMHLKELLDHLAARDHRLVWGPGRHGAGHNIFTYHPGPDGGLVELFCEIDMVFDERTGYFEPRPWHEELPQGPRVWPLDPASANTWGPVNPDMLDH